MLHHILKCVLYCAAAVYRASSSPSVESTNPRLVAIGLHGPTTYLPHHQSNLISVAILVCTNENEMAAAKMCVVSKDIAGQQQPSTAT